MSSILYMRSLPEDRTARAVIRDEALRLFAAHGPDAVTIRQVATAASVSPGLVVHHFGSKEGLREAVDRYVVGAFEEMLGQMTSASGPDLFDPSATRSLAEAVVAHLPPDSPAPAYLRRLLLADGTDGSGRRLFRQLFDLSKATLAELARAGLASPGADPDVRAAFLMANDLSVLLLREHLTDILGSDPLTRDGMARWAREAMAVYGPGLLANPEGGQQ